ncbi:MBL fold metallo-hydrolase [bacterium]|nr:MBL fold metallo-hydrolase [candidate division CSSED10-310 bacterium]
MARTALLLLLLAAGCVTLGLPRASSPTELTIHFLDVDYGLAILIHHRDGTAVLVDSGSMKYGDRVAEYIRGLGIDTVDLVINTHPHPDHIEGLVRVLELMPVPVVWGAFEAESREVSAEFRRALAADHAEYRTVRRGELWRRGDLVLEVLHPVTLVADLNDSSLVLRLRYKGFVAILAADIGPAAQRELLDAFPEQLHAAVLQIPHHGGEGIPEFVTAVLPEAAVLSVGPNIYGNPHAETLMWYGAAGASLLRTDVLGDIVVASNGRNFTVTTSRTSGVD